MIAFCRVVSRENATFLRYIIRGREPLLGNRILFKGGGKRRSLNIMYLFNLIQNLWRRLGIGTDLRDGLKASGLVRKNSPCISTVIRDILDGPEFQVHTV